MLRLRCALTVGAVLLLALAPAGCRNKKNNPPEATGNPLKPDPAGGRTAQNELQRPGQRLVNENLMRNLGQYYNFYVSEKGKPPRTLDEFRTYVKADPNARNEAAALDKDWVVFVLDPPPTGHQVLAYEKDVYQKLNNRLALFADGSVEMMEDAAFQKALKGQ